MYFAITSTALALTVFVPSFIGLRSRTNDNWRKLWSRKHESQLGLSEGPHRMRPGVFKARISNLAFVLKGHDFSRAEKRLDELGFTP